MISVLFVCFVASTVSATPLAVSSNNSGREPTCDKVKTNEELKLILGEGLIPLYMSETSHFEKTIDYNDKGICISHDHVVTMPEGTFPPYIREIRCSMPGRDCMPNKMCKKVMAFVKVLKRTCIPNFPPTNP